MQSVIDVKSKNSVHSRVSPIPLTPCPKMHTSPRYPQLAGDALVRCGRQVKLQLLSCIGLVLILFVTPLHLTTVKPRPCFKGELKKKKNFVMSFYALEMARVYACLFLHSYSLSLSLSLSHRYCDYKALFFTAESTLLYISFLSPHSLPFSLGD